MTRYILIFICCCSVSCNSTKLAVSWADTFLAWEINDTFDLDTHQKKQVRPEIDDALKVAKKELFPEYAKMLLNAKNDLEKASTLPEAAKTISSISKQVTDLIKSTLRKVKPQILKISDQIQFGNWQEFKQEYQDRTEELSGEKGSYNDKFKSRLEDWVGNLSAAQIKAIEDFKKASPFPNKERVANRSGALESFEKKSEITTNSINKDKFRIALSEWLDDYESKQTYSYVEATKKYRVSLENFLAEFYMGLNSKQKTKLFSNIEKRAQDLLEISNEK